MDDRTNMKIRDNGKRVVNYGERIRIMWRAAATYSLLDEADVSTALEFNGDVLRSG